LVINWGLYNDNNFPNYKAIGGEVFLVATTFVSSNYHVNKDVDMDLKNTMRRVTFKKFTIFGFLCSGVFVFSFSLGIFQYFGQPILIPKLGAAVFSILVFFISVGHALKNNNSFFRFKYFRVHIFMLLIGSVSFLINGANVSAYLLFLRDTLPCFLLFLAILNYANTDYKTINNVLISLFLIQIPVSWIKLNLIGINEHWIGTVHYNAGQLSLILPAVAVAFIYPKFLEEKKIFLVILVICFLGFSIIGQKRTVIVLFPLLFVSMYVIYVLESLNKRSIIEVLSKLIKPVLVLIALTLIFIYLIIIYLPSTYEGGKELRSFNFGTSYLLTYNFRNYELNDNGKKMDSSNVDSDVGIQMGRGAVTIAAVKFIKNSDISNVLFGFGPMVTRSSVIAGNEPDQMYTKFKIRGSTPGFVIYLLEYGILGVLAIVWLFKLVHTDMYNYLKFSTNKKKKSFFLGCLGLNFVFIFDFFIYSGASLHFGVILPVYYYLIAFSHNLFKTYKTEHLPFSHR